MGRLFPLHSFVLLQGQGLTTCGEAKAARVEDQLGVGLVLLRAIFRISRARRLHVSTKTRLAARAETNAFERGRIALACHPSTASRRSGGVPRSITARAIARPASRIIIWVFLFCISPISVAKIHGEPI